MFYSHRLVNNYGIFSEFNKFLSKAIYCQQNNFFGKAMSQILVKKKKILLKVFVLLVDLKIKTLLS